MLARSSGGEGEMIVILLPVNEDHPSLPRNTIPNLTSIHSPLDRANTADHENLQGGHAHLHGLIVEGEIALQR